jgi:hypothetical protein
MKRFVLSLLLVPFLLLGTAAGQKTSESKAKSAKLLTVSGKVSEDGKSVMAKNGQAWSVSNPGTLVGYEGQQVKLKCQYSLGTHEIQVLFVKAIHAQPKYAAHPGDSAFRR